MMGPRESSTYANNLTAITNICSELGIPLALEKVEGPSHCLDFLGITLNTKLMQARLPKDKLKQIRWQVADWLPCKKATKREILSLVGLMQHLGWTFGSRCLLTLSSAKKDLSAVQNLAAVQPLPSIVIKSGPGWLVCFFRYAKIAFIGQIMLSIAPTYTSVPSVCF